MAVKGRRSSGCLIGGTVLLGVLAVAIIFWPRVARRAFFDRLEAAGARVSYLPGGPDWLRDFLGDSPMEAFDDLWQLDLSRTEIDRDALDDLVAHLRDCPQVFELDLSQTPLNDPDLEFLRAAPELHELNLTGTDVSDAGLQHVAGCENLRALILSNTGVTDAGLAHLRTLKKLDVLILDGTKVGDAGMELLYELPQLRNLSVSNTDVTDEGVHHLSEELPDLAVSDD